MRRFSGLSALLVLGAAIVALPRAAEAFPVDGAFGQMPKAIYFTGSAKPSNAVNLGRADGTATGGAYETFDSGILMHPVGDGSWFCTATVFRGASYTYEFEHRVPRYDVTETRLAAFAYTEPDGDRSLDYSRTITIPDTAGIAGQRDMYIYNTYQDQSVYVAFDPTSASETVALSETSTAINLNNPYLQYYQGNDRRTGDADTGSIEGDNIYGVDAVQVSDANFAVSWSFNPNGDVSPIVAGDLIYDTSGTNTFADYGFRILRAPDTTSAGIANVTFLDITSTISTYAGDSVISESGGATWPAVTLTAVDTSATETPDTYIYVIVPFTAYRFLGETTAQNFSGGYDTVSRGAAIRVIFIVEMMDGDVVFRDGSNKGWVWITPYIDGVRRYDLKMRVPAARVRRQHAENVG